MKKDSQKLKVTESFRKIFQISFLLLVREFYSFLANLYGLVCHPFLTLKSLKRQKDFSQKVLIFGLPGYFWLGTIIFLAVFRSLIGVKGDLGWIAQTLLVLVTSISALFFSYLLFWLFKTLRKLNEGENGTPFKA